MDNIKYRQAIFNEDDSLNYFHYWGYSDAMYIAPKIGGMPQIYIDTSRKYSDLCVGLNDCGGEELYNNDRVHLFDCNPNEGIIKYIEGGFCVWFDDDIDPIDINFFYPSTGCTLKKIGTIYEGIKK